MVKINLLLILFAFLFSQDDDIHIIDIRVEGNQRLSAQDIQRNARLYKGMSIQGPEIQQAIKRLWNLKRFGNIQILVDDETDNGIYLRIVVEENPSLGEVEYVGNKKKSKRSLNEELEMLKISYKLLNKDGQLFIECRSTNDPLSQKGEILSQTERILGHYRRFIILDEFIQRLVQVGFEVVEAIENIGLAKFGEEDPMIIRVKAIKN